MEIHQEKPDIVETVVTDIKARYGIDKAREGVHMTDCLYCLRKAFWDKVDRLPPSPMETLYFILGLGSQDAIMGKDSATGSQMGYEVDGIKLSPDLVVTDSNKRVFPVELKTTRISNKRLHSKDIPDGWIKQLKGYCYALGSDYGVLIAVPIISPEIISFRVEFTKDELLEQWNDIVEKAAMLNLALKAGIVPKYAHNQEWECKNCRYKLRCQTHAYTNPTSPKSEPVAKASVSKLSEYKNGE